MLCICLYQCYVTIQHLLLGVGLALYLSIYIYICIYNHSAPATRCLVMALYLVLCNHSAHATRCLVMALYLYIYVTIQHLLLGVGLALYLYIVTMSCTCYQVLGHGSIPICYNHSAPATKCRSGSIPIYICYVTIQHLLPGAWSWLYIYLVLCIYI